MKKITTLCVALFSSALVQISAQVPALNSFPGVGPTIFLDFDGHTVNTVYWNGGNPFEATAPSFTAAQIITMFNMVAEDFRPFNVNITTDSTVYFAAPINRRQRIVITNNSSWYGNAGGVAYVGSFRWGLEIPAFVFSNLLQNNTKFVAEAISHETGHTLGLQHQSRYDENCGFQNEYNSGTGSGEISWAPIMGNSYHRNLTLWHNGSSSLGCSQIQNDLQIITGTNNGITFRSDDVGNSTNQSSPVTFNGNSFGINGFINATSDVDVFRFNIPDRGRFIVNAVPFNVGSNATAANIDMRVEFLSRNGSVLNTYNPSTQVAAIIDTTIDAGTYYLRISNVSNVNTTNFGMLGSYSMSGTFLGGATLPIYSLSLTGNVTNGRHDLRWNIIADEPIESIMIQASGDGRHFQDLTPVDPEARSYSHQPHERNKTQYYRLSVVTASQLHYYSNIISLKEGKTQENVTLISNTIAHELVMVSKANYDWRMMDMNGRVVNSGRLTNGFNRVATQSMPAGMYLLQVIDGPTLTTHKILKR